MEKIVIERFVDGQMYVTDTIEISHRLLNEQDLDMMVGDGTLAFVRHQLNTTHGYYKDCDDRWAYGTYEDAINEIKRRI